MNFPKCPCIINFILSTLKKENKNIIKQDTIIHKKNNKLVFKETVTVHIGWQDYKISMRNACTVSLRVLPKLKRKK